MVDANVLSTTDSTGALLWHPRGLPDFDALPERVFTLWRDMRDGFARRGEPWTWWRPRGVPTSHQYEASPFGVPEQARCGHEPYRDGPVADWIRDAGEPHCGACKALGEREARPAAGWGRIGDTLLGPDGHPLAQP